MRFRRTRTEAPEGRPGGWDSLSCDGLPGSDVLYSCNPNSWSVYRADIVNLSLRSRENFLVWGYEATGNYFQTLGIQPQVGRFFTPAEDDVPGAHPVLVPSNRYWHSHFAGDPRVLGQTVRHNGYSFTIIGVAPATFTGTELILSCDF